MAHERILNGVFKHPFIAVKLQFHLQTEKH